MDRFEFYKELYHVELERKEQINTRLQWIVSIWILLIGGILFCLNNYYKVPDYLNGLFLIIITGCFLTLAYATLFIAKYLYGKTFEYAPSTKEFEYEYEQLHIYYEPYPSYHHLIDEEFTKNSIKIYMDCATQIRKVNNGNLKSLLISSRWLLISALFLFLGFSMMIFDFLKKEEPVDKIELINVNEVEQLDKQQVLSKGHLKLIEKEE